MTSQDLRRSRCPGYRKSKCAMFQRRQGRARVSSPGGPDALHSTTEGPLGFAARAAACRRAPRPTDFLSPRSVSTPCTGYYPGPAVFSYAGLDLHGRRRRTMMRPARAAGAAAPRPAQPRVVDARRRHGAVPAAARRRHPGARGPPGSGAHVRRPRRGREEHRGLPRRSYRGDQGRRPATGGRSPGDVRARVIGRRVHWFRFGRNSPASSPPPTYSYSPAAPIRSAS